jgi:hypothetical protein
MSFFRNELGVRKEYMFKVNKSRSERFPCPVCGFPLKYPADDFNICPSCGVEFGYETAGRTFDELRREWIRAGAHWTSRVDERPTTWNAWKQLIDAGFAYALPFHVELHPHRPNVFQGSFIAPRSDEMYVVQLT